MGAEVDSIEIAVKTTADEANRSLDNLIKKMGLVAQVIAAITKGSGLEEFSKQVKNLSKNDGLDKAIKSAGKSKNAVSTGSKIADDLANGFIKEFNIKSKEAQQQIADLSKSLYDSTVQQQTFGNVENWGNEIEKFGEVISKNATIIQGKMGIYDDFYRYFKGIDKITIPDTVKGDLGEDYNKMRMAAPKTFTSAGGIELDSVYQELSDKFKDLFSGTSDQTKQFTEIVDALRAFRADVDKEMRPDTTKGSLFDQQMWDSIVEAVGRMGAEVQKSVSGIKIQMDSAKSSADEFVGTIEHMEAPKSTPSAPQKPKMVSAENMGYNADAMAMVFGENARNIKDWGDAVAQYGKQAGMMMNKISKEANDAVNPIEELGNKLSELTVPEIKEENLDKLKKNLEKVEAKTESLQNKLSNGLTMGTVSESTDNKSYVRMQTDIALAEKEAEGLRKKIEEVADATRKLERREKIFSAIKTTFGKLASAAGTLAKTITSGVAKAFSVLTNRTKKHASSMLSNFKTMLKYTLGVRSLYMAVRKLRTAFVDGMNNLVQYSQETNASVSLLWNSMTQLKNSVAAAAAPLVNALAPALNAIIQLCINAVNAINQLLSALTGHGTWIKAKKLTDDYSKSLGGASKAADKLKDHTLGIDELNVVKQDDSSGGGGGGSGTAAKDMFTTESIDSSISNFADQLKAAFEASDWKSLGTLLGNKFNDLVDMIKWSDFGKKVGKSLNGAIQTAYWTLKAADFKNLGNHVAEFINSSLEEIDFTYLGALLVRKFTAVLDFVIGALGGLDWSLVGKSIGDGLKGAFDEAQQWIVSYDWHSIGDGLWQNLKKFIEGSDPVGVAQSFFKALGSALGATVATIQGFIGGIVADINAYFQKYILNDDGTKKSGRDLAAGILQGILDALGNIGQWIVDNVFTPFLNGFKEAFGIHSPSTVMAEQGRYLIEGLLEGMKDLWKTVYQWFKDSIIQPIKDSFKNACDNIKEYYSNLRTDVENLWNTVAEWFNTNVIMPLENFFRGLWQKVSNFFKQLWNDIKTVWSAVSGWFKSTVIEPVQTGFSTFKEKVGGFFTSLWDGIKGTWNSVSGWFNNTVISPVKNAFDSACKAIDGFFGSLWKNVKSGVATAMNAVIGAVEKAINGVIRAMNKLSWEIPEGVPLFGGTKFGFDISEISLGRVQAYAAGGFPEDGLFYANHNEMVGQFSNGQTAVANNEQIVAGIAAGVREAVADVLAPYLSQIEQNTRETADKDTSISIDGRELVSAINNRVSRNGFSFT